MTYRYEDDELAERARAADEQHAYEQDRLVRMQTAADMAHALGLLLDDAQDQADFEQAESECRDLLSKILKLKDGRR